MSTTYHPQSDDQTEVLNRILEQYLRAFVHNQPSQWGKFLSLAEWCYNITTHSSTKLTSYEVTYGKPPPSVPNYMSGSSHVDVVDFMQVSRQETFRFLKKKLKHAQASMKKIVDAHHKDVIFVVGVWVYVKLRPYRQSSISDNKYHELGKRYFGPYKIVERVGPVAYKLALPESSKIHHVFHCSLLKPHFGPIHSENPLPPTSSEGKPIIQLLVVLDSKWDSSTPPRKLVLVQ